MDFTSRDSTGGNSKSTRSTKKSSTGSKSGIFGKKIETIEKALDSIKDEGYVCVPELAPELKHDLGDMKVLKVKLSDHFRHCEIDDKLYPAWSLFGMRGVANWCEYAEHPFVPSGQDHSSNPDQDAFSLSSVEASLGSSFSELSDEEWEAESKNDPDE